MFLNDNPGRNIYIFLVNIVNKQQQEQILKLWKNKIYILMQWFYDGFIYHAS